MAIYNSNDSYLSFGGQVISDHVTNLTLQSDYDTNDKTAMGASSRQMKASLANWSLTFECQQDFAANELDALVAAAGSSREVAIEVRPTSASASATNPKWTGTVVVQGYPPVSGAVGDLAVVSVNCVAASDLTRAES